MENATVTESTLQLITRFEEGFNKRDAEALMRGVDIFRVRDGKIAEKLMYGTL